MYDISWCHMIINVSWCFFIMYYDICVFPCSLYFTVSVLNPMYHQFITLYHGFIPDLAFYSSMILPCCIPTLHITCTYLSLPHLYHVLWWFYLYVPHSAFTVSYFTIMVLLIYIPKDSTSLPICVHHDPTSVFHTLSWLYSCTIVCHNLFLTHKCWLTILLVGLWNWMTEC